MLKLFDTHASLIQRDVLSYAGTSLARLDQRSFPLDAYANDTAGRGIAATLLVSAEADDLLAEARLAAAAKRDAGASVRGIVAGCDPWQKTSERILADWADLPVVSARLVWSGQSDTGPINALMPALASVGLCAEMDVRVPDWDLVSTLAGDNPETTFVLSHAGRPGIADDALAQWQEGTARFAAPGNTFCKVSGLFRFCRPHAVDVDAVRPIFNHLYHVFGSERLVWGSDWPAVENIAALQDWITAFRTLVADLPKHDQIAICHGTAERLYGTGV